MTCVAGDFYVLRAAEDADITPLLLHPNFNYWQHGDITHEVCNLVMIFGSYLT